MKIEIYKSMEEMGLKEAEHIAEIIQAKKNPLLCIPAGSSAECVFSALVKLYEEGGISFKDVKFVGLDEWCGYYRYEGTCRWMLDNALFKHIDVKEENMRFFNSNPEDREKECAEMEKFIKDNGGIDYLLLGVGMNGHLALNEPGCDIHGKAHSCDLAEKTREVSVKYFDYETQLKYGITLGIENFREARETVVIFNCERKADIFEQFIKSAPTNELPVSLVKEFNNVRVISDLAAASKIYIE
ncbi:MAG: 6-phosphogluconolactonase [Erysipelotrichaceae bacterium]